MYIQVSIRLILNDKRKISALEIYYRFKKDAIKTNLIEKTEDKDKTEEIEFEQVRDFAKLTDWRGSLLISSSMAKMFHKLLDAIGMNEIEKIIERME